MTSYQPSSFTRSLLAAVDLSAKQFHYVGDDGTGKADVRGGATGEIGFGILMNKPLADEECEIAGPGGGSKVKISATVSAAQLELKADTAGTMSPATSAGDIVSAISLEPGATNDLIEIQLVHYRKHA